MKHKKFVKQLMSLGIQRNDAASYAKVSRELRAKGKGNMAPDWVDPPVPIIVIEQKIKTFAASFACGIEYEMVAIPYEEKREYIKRHLGEELGKGLIDSGLCKISATLDKPAHAVVYRATIDVAVPREVQA